MNEPIDWKKFDWLVKTALREDHADEDATTMAIVPENSTCKADIISKEDAIVCGLPLAGRICEIFESQIDLEPKLTDGNRAESGTVIATVKGPTASILSVERTMLNFLQRLSGISTLTGMFVDETKGTNARIMDTRKTTPGWRELEKYAVRCGGGTNHRMGLHDQILIKENHIQSYSSGGESSATSNSAEVLPGLIERARSKFPDLPVEMEVENIQQFSFALECNPDIILLDNFSPDEIGMAVSKRRKTRNGGVLLEASGGITLGNVRAYAETGVDRISVGSLTHSARACDLSLLIRITP